MIKKICFFTFTFLSLLTLWELCARFFPNLIFVLPAPSKIALSLIHWRHRFFFHSLATFKEMLGGFFLATFSAFGLAWMMVRFKMTRALLQPLFIIIQCLPMFALAPLMVIWFGWGYSAIVLPTALMIFFPLTLNIYQGFKETPKPLLEFFEINGATNRQTFFHLYLPSAMGHIFAGLRIAAAISGIGAIAGEWAGAQQGLGILMLETRRNLDLEVTFGALICLALMSFLLYGTIMSLEKIRAHFPHLFQFHRFEPLKEILKGRPRKIAFALVCLITFTLLSWSCEQTSNNKQVRIMLDWLPNQNHLPLYVGVQKGYFQNEGINLVIQKMHDSGSAISYLASEQTDLAIYHLPGTLRANSLGANFKIIGYLIKSPLQSLIYLANPLVKEPKDLTGKVLGYCIGGSDTSFLEFLLKHGEISPSKKLNIQVEIISALTQGAVDFVYGGFWNIEPTILHSFGVECGVFKMDQLKIPSYSEMMILAHGDSIYSSSKFIDSFQRALQKSINFCKEQPQQAFEIYACQNPDKRAQTLEWEKSSWLQNQDLMAQDQSMELEQARQFHEWQLEQKIVSKRIDPLTLFPVNSTVATGQ